MVFLVLSITGFSGISNAQELKTVNRKDGQKTSFRVYRPDVKGCPPLALISPGAGGTENGMKYLAEALEDDGWLAIVLGHKESGPAVFRTDVHEYGLREGLLKMTTDSQAYKDRFLDIDAALNWIQKQCNPSFRALIGHSMGAATVMLEAGAKNKLGILGENQFDAYVALSPQGPGSIFTEHAWKDIRKPVLILTGTRDRALEGDWHFRTKPFEDMSPGCKWLGVISGATHLNFAGMGFAHRATTLTDKYATTFLDRLRKGSCGKPPEERNIMVRSK